MSNRMPRRFSVTTRTHEVFAIAHGLADRLGRTEVTPLHVLLAILREGRSPAVVVLHGLAARLETLERQIEAALPAPVAVRKPLPALTWTASEEQMLALAEVEAREIGHAYQGCEHLLLAFLRDTTSSPAHILGRHGVRFDNARAEVLRILGAPRHSDESTSKSSGV
jgi:ATP-dependent Clp protease ATP-binding subunit ClpC